MTIKISLLAAALASSSLFVFSASAHEPKPLAQDTKCHDMKGMDMKGMDMKGMDMKGMDMKGMDMKGMDMKGMDMKGPCAGSMEMHKIMMSGMKMPMKMSGNVDKDFASMMSMHHQQAIKMADVMIKDGSNAQLKSLARKMKAAQQAEIKQLAVYTK